MGCGCGGAAQDFDVRYLVTLSSGEQRLVTSEVGAALAVTLGGGGTWRKVDADEAEQLRQQGITAS